MTRLGLWLSSVQVLGHFSNILVLFQINVILSTQETIPFFHVAKVREALYSRIKYCRYIRTSSNILSRLRTNEAPTISESEQSLPWESLETLMRTAASMISSGYCRTSSSKEQFRTLNKNCEHKQDQIVAGSNTTNEPLMNCGNSVLA